MKVRGWYVPVLAAAVAYAVAPPCLHAVQPPTEADVAGVFLRVVQRLRGQPLQSLLVQGTMDRADEVAVLVTADTEQSSNVRLLAMAASPPVLTQGSRAVRMEVRRGVPPPADPLVLRSLGVVTGDLLAALEAPGGAVTLESTSLWCQPRRSVVSGAWAQPILVSLNGEAVDLSAVEALVRRLRRGADGARVSSVNMCWQSRGDWRISLNVDLVCALPAAAAPPLQDPLTALRALLVEASSTPGTTSTGCAMVTFVGASTPSAPFSGVARATLDLPWPPGYQSARYRLRFGDARHIIDATLEVRMLDARDPTPDPGQGPLRNDGAHYQDIEPPGQ